MYARNPDRFAGDPSHFVEWALARFPDRDGPRNVLELGCGVGRDSRVIAAAGHRVLAVDHSSVAILRARADPRSFSALRFVERDASAAVSEAKEASFDVVYAHGLYMGFTDGELGRLLDGILRILAPGGHHLFAVRSTTDPHYGQGTEIEPDVFYGGVHETPMRYYRRESLARFTRPGLVRFAEEHRPDLYLWYVGDRRS